MMTERSDADADAPIAAGSLKRPRAISIRRRGTKVVVTGIPEHEALDHVSALTVQPAPAYIGPDPMPITVASWDGNALVVPHVYANIHFGASDSGLPLPSDDQTNRQAFSFCGELQAERAQPDAVAGALRALRDDRIRGAMVVLPCGYGKTVVATAIVAALSCRSIVLVHTECLLTQWRERLSQYLPNARVGSIQGEEVHTDGCDVVIAMIQSVHCRDYAVQHLEGYGLLVVDEAHHICARTFASAFFKVGATACVGLSATPRRKDGLTPFLAHMVGPVAFQIDRSATLNATVTIIKPPRRPTLGPIYLHGGRIKGNGGRPALNLSRMITDLCADDLRNASIAGEIHRHVLGGHNILVLSHRVEHLSMLRSRVAALLGVGEDDARMGVLTGKTKRAAAAAAKDCQLIFSTYAMAAEGLDIARLDTEVLATPASDVEQAIGRVLRAHPGKHACRVLDFYDDYSAFVGMLQARMRCYHRSCFVVTSAAEEAAGGEEGETAAA